MHHAPRIRTISCSWQWDTIAYLRTLYACRPDKSVPLLPGLQNFTCTSSADSPDCFIPIKLLAHPGVRTVHITCGAAGDTPLEFLQELAPDIQRLYVSLATPCRERGAFSDLHRLTTFYCRTTLCSSVFLRHLGCLPDLRIVDVYVDSKTLSPLTDDTAMFPTLQRLLLTVSGSDTVDVPRFLRVVASKELEMVSVTLDRLPTSASISLCAQIIAKQPNLSRVYFLVQLPFDLDSEVITNLIIDDELMQTEPYIVTGNDLRPLLAVTHMCTLVMRGIPLSFKDGDLQEMALAWPHLKDLVLGSAPETSLLGVTLEGLKPLSEHCPMLRSLAVVLDATSPHPSFWSRRSLRTLKNIARLRPMGSSRRHSQASSLTISTGPPNWDNVDSEPVAVCTRLECLDLSNSLIRDPSYVASFIARYFPNVREVADVSLIGPDNLHMLEKVNKALKKHGKERWQVFDKKAGEAGLPETFHSSSCCCGHCRMNSLYLILYPSGLDVD